MSKTDRLGDKNELMRRKLSAERFTLWLKQSGRSTAELVDALGGLENGPQTIYNWKQRGVPADKAIALSKLPPSWPRRSADWFRGEPESYQQPTDRQGLPENKIPEITTESLTPEERALLATFRQLDTAGRTSAAEDVAKIKRMMDLERELAELKNAAK